MVSLWEAQQVRSKGQHQQPRVEVCWPAVHWLCSVLQAHPAPQQGTQQDSSIAGLGRFGYTSA
jgi:hypothetical protein